MMDSQQEIKGRKYTQVPSVYRTLESITEASLECCLKITRNRKMDSSVQKSRIEILIYVANIVFITYIAVEQYSIG